MELSWPKLASHHTSIWFDSISFFSFYTWLCSHHFQVFWFSHWDTEMCLLMKQRDIFLSEPYKEIPQSFTTGTGKRKVTSGLFCVSPPPTIFCVFSLLVPFKWRPPPRLVFPLSLVISDCVTRCTNRSTPWVTTEDLLWDFLKLFSHSVESQCNLNLPYMLLYVGWRNIVLPIPD